MKRSWGQEQAAARPRGRFDCGRERRGPRGRAETLSSDRETEHPPIVIDAGDKALVPLPWSSPSPSHFPVLRFFPLPPLLVFRTTTTTTPSLEPFRKIRHQLCCTPTSLATLIVLDHQLCCSRLSSSSLITSLVVPANLCRFRRSRRLVVLGHRSCGV